MRRENKDEGRPGQFLYPGPMFSVFNRRDTRHHRWDSSNAVHSPCQTLQILGIPVGSPVSTVSTISTWRSWPSWEPSLPDCQIGTFGGDSRQSTKSTYARYQVKPYDMYRSRQRSTATGDWRLDLGISAHPAVLGLLPLAAGANTSVSRD